MARRRTVQPPRAGVRASLCTLKDDSCQIRAVIFRSTAVGLRFALEDGFHIVARGRATVYAPRGEYQIVLEYAEPKWLGALQLAFEQLKHRLAAEGLFDLNRKRALPFCPRTVGIVTSATGAAVSDIISVLHRRCPLLRIILAPVPVQGEGAARHIADAIYTLNASSSSAEVVAPWKICGASTRKSW